jgi:membrane protease YdiL (CAAX protease family)
VITPLFAIGYYLFYDTICHHAHWKELALPGTCRAYKGLSGIHWPRLDASLAKFVAVQIVVVALPEELFFRGCLLELLERRFPPKRRIAGGGVGLALLISAAMFALIHLPKDGDPRALSTFFPGLVFGWMRSSTKSILAPVIAHSSSNIMVRVLDSVILAR